MTTNRRDQVLRLYHRALAHEAADRTAFLAEACAEDEELRQRVVELLSSEPPSAFLGLPDAAPETALDGDDVDRLIGREIGPYRIQSSVGAGGMGHVFRARDTALGRDVAIKVLPRRWSHDPERLARLEREARVLATLNHPHVGAIYGLERIEGSLALVLEFVDGETLFDRIARYRSATGGGIPLRDALALARQVADALDAAHERGIVHRDLKPANIKVTADGSAKVLDFGLATEASPGDPFRISDPSSDAVPADLTRRGVVMGTAAYMSPEQARGERVDKRTDVWAFGCVLYEMLTGRRPFGGKDASRTLAAVLTSEPDWSVLPPVPAPIALCLRQCLEKDSRRRLRDIGDARLALDTRFEPEPAVGPIVQRRRRRARASSAAALVVAVFAIGALSWWLGRGADTPEALGFPVRFEIRPPTSGSIAPGPPAVSPDGRTVAIVVRNADGTTVVHLRPIGSVESRPLPGTEGAVHVFWAPNGRSLAFVHARMLKRIDVAGGPARILSPDVGGVWSGAWNQFGDLIFNGRDGLLRVPAEGGRPAAVLRRETGWPGFSHPSFLPDGRHFLVRKATAEGVTSIDLASLDSNETKPVLTDVNSAPIVVQAHDRRTYIVYLRNDTLVAQEFDLERENIRGAPRRLVAGIGRVGSPAIVPAIGVSRGVIAFQNGGDSDAYHRTWVSRSGTPVGELALPAYGVNFSLSSDDRHLAVDENRGSSRDVSVIDLLRQAPLLLTHGGMFPIWTHDDQRVIFQRRQRIYVTSAHGTGEETPVGELTGIPRSVSRDGRFLLYDTIDGMWMATFPEGRPAGRLGPAGAIQGRFSPDGRFVAYTSNESGRFEVYIRGLPPSAVRVRVSTNGGAQPRWSRATGELFFISAGQQLMATNVRLEPTLSVDSLRPLFQLDTAPGPVDYSVSADARRFLVPRSRSIAPDGTVTVVANWRFDSTAPVD